ncbi:hypothetical protein PR048_028612 [Dryococelus australis]|uniref:Uncharacterized protein n=1 Tax=Dryococelus australis TaxID=614101 RepID=A0ABQ9GB21_9NEOP|nr:hypothetical protein PR048_028612 [Dryococelus australis]
MASRYVSARAGETGDPRENAPTSGIAQDDSHMRTSEARPSGIEPCSSWWEASSLTTTPPRSPTCFLGFMSSFVPLAFFSRMEELQLETSEEYKKHASSPISSKCPELRRVFKYQEQKPQSQEARHHVTYGIMFNTIHRPGHSRTLASGNSAGQCRWSRVFLGNLPFLPPLQSGDAPEPPHLTLVGSQGLVVDVEHHRSARAFRENPSNGVAVRHDPHLLKHGSESAGIRSRFASGVGESSGRHIIRGPHRFVQEKHKNGVVWEYRSPRIGHEVDRWAQGKASGEAHLTRLWGGGKRLDALNRSSTVSWFHGRGGVPLQERSTCRRPAQGDGERRPTRSGMRPPSRCDSEHRFALDPQSLMPGCAIMDESEIQNHEISLVQHFYIETKIKLDRGSELRSFDLRSGKMLGQPGLSIVLQARMLVSAVTSWVIGAQMHPPPHVCPVVRRVFFVESSREDLSHIPYAISSMWTFICPKTTSKPLFNTVGTRLAPEKTVRVPVLCFLRRFVIGRKSSEVCLDKLSSGTDRSSSVLLHLGKPDSITGWVALRFSQVELMPGDAAGRRFLTGSPISPRPCIPTLLHTHLTSPSSNLKTSMLRATQISTLHSRSPNFASAHSNALFRMMDACSMHGASPPDAPMAVAMAEYSLHLNSMIWAGLNSEVLRADEGDMEQRRNGRAGEMGDPRENPPTSGIVRHDSHMQTFGSEQANRSAAPTMKRKRCLGPWLYREVATAPRDPKTPIAMSATQIVDFCRTHQLWTKFSHSRCTSCCKTKMRWSDFHLLLMYPTLSRPSPGTNVTAVIPYERQLQKLPPPANKRGRKYQRWERRLLSWGDWNEKTTEDGSFFSNRHWQSEKIQRIIYNWTMKIAHRDETMVRSRNETTSWRAYDPVSARFHLTAHPVVQLHAPTLGCSRSLADARNTRRHRHRRPQLTDPALPDRAVCHRLGYFKAKFATKNYENATIAIRIFRIMGIDQTTAAGSSGYMTAPTQGEMAEDRREGSRGDPVHDTGQCWELLCPHEPFPGRLVEAHMRARSSSRVRPLIMQQRRYDAGAMRNAIDWLCSVFSGTLVNATIPVSLPSGIIPPAGIIVWSAVAYDGRSTLIMLHGILTAQLCIGGILSPRLLPFLAGIPGPVFQRDDTRTAQATGRPGLSHVTSKHRHGLPAPLTCPPSQAGVGPVEMPDAAVPQCPGFVTHHPLIVGLVCLRTPAGVYWTPCQTVFQRISQCEGNWEKTNTFDVVGWARTWDLKNVRQVNQQSGGCDVVRREMAGVGVGPSRATGRPVPEPQRRFLPRASCAASPPPSSLACATRVKELGRRAAATLLKFYFQDIPPPRTNYA